MENRSQKKNASVRSLGITWGRVQEIKVEAEKKRAKLAGGSPNKRIKKYI